MGQNTSGDMGKSLTQIKVKDIEGKNNYWKQNDPLSTCNFSYTVNKKGNVCMGLFSLYVVMHIISIFSG